MTELDKFADDFANKLWDDPLSSPVCQYADDIKMIYRSGFQKALEVINSKLEKGLELTDILKQIEGW